ncbi:unnamed protein product [Urochloa humidicola]
MQDCCWNCLSLSHRVATCRLPYRCWLCHGFRHIAKDCPRRRSPSPNQRPTRRTPASGGAASRPAQGTARNTARRFDRLNGPPTPPASQVPSRTPSPEPMDVSPACSPAASTVPLERPASPEEPECCYIDRSGAMAAEEERLRFALLAVVTNASGEFDADDAHRALAAVQAVTGDAFTVTPFHPEHFLVICSTADTRNRFLAASPIPLGVTSLSLLPWTRLVHANSKTLLSKVTIEIDGIPPHAWDLDTASKLLAGYCWIEQLAPATANKTDMTTF